MGELGPSFMAFSNTFGRSLAPGGSLFLLGLPWGVEKGEVNPICVGVCGLSEYSFPDRVCKGGGGIGMLKAGLLDPPREGGFPAAAMMEV